MNQNQINKASWAAQLKAQPAKIKHLLLTKKFWVELLIMTVAMFVASIAVHFFLVPSKLIVGSITGLSMVFSQVFPVMSLGTYIFVINAILIVLSFILLGNEFGAKTVYTALILGPMIEFWEQIAPIKHSVFTTFVAGQPVGNPWFDLLLFIIILSGSQSILFSINASTGGLDIVAKIINKYLHADLGLSVTISGGLICSTAFLINDVNLVIIGLIGTWLNGIMLSHFMSGIHSRQRICIISKDHAKIQDYIINTLHRGATLYNVTGGYDNQPKVEIEAVLTREECSKLMAFIASEDIAAFSTAGVVQEVYGIWNRKASPFS